MSDRNITVKIDGLGNPVIEANNFHGMNCTDATAPIERALTGGDGKFTRDLKPSFYETGNEQEQQHQTW